jgi:hypothetical protein
LSQFCCLQGDLCVATTNDPSISAAAVSDSFACAAELDAGGTNIQDSVMSILGNDT